MLSSKKLSITRVRYNSLDTLLKSKDVTAYLLHAQRIRKTNIAGIVNEKIVHEEAESMDNESVESAQWYMRAAIKWLTFVPVAGELNTRYRNILPTRD